MGVRIVKCHAIFDVLCHAVIRVVIGVHVLHLPHLLLPTLCPNSHTVPGREESGKGVFGSGTNQVNHGLRLALRRVDGDTESVANRYQAGDSLLNVLQKPSRSIMNQGNKEVIEESGPPKGNGLRKIITRLQQERTWVGEVNEKAFVQKGLLELLLVLEEGNA